MVNTNCSVIKSPNYMKVDDYKLNTTGMFLNFLDPTAYYSITYAFQCSWVWSFIDRYVEWFLFNYI